MLKLIARSIVTLGGVVVAHQRQQKDALTVQISESAHFAQENAKPSLLTMQPANTSHEEDEHDRILADPALYPQEFLERVHAIVSQAEKLAAWCNWVLGDEGKEYLSGKVRIAEWKRMHQDTAYLTEEELKKIEEQTPCLYYLSQSPDPYTSMQASLQHEERFTEEILVKMTEYIAENLIKRVNNDKAVEELLIKMLVALFRGVPVLLKHDQYKLLENSKLGKLNKMPQLGKDQIVEPPLEQIKKPFRLVNVNRQKVLEGMNKKIVPALDEHWKGFRKDKDIRHGELSDLLKLQPLLVKYYKHMDELRKIPALELVLRFGSSGLGVPRRQAPGERRAEAKYCENLLDTVKKNIKESDQVMQGLRNFFAYPKAANKAQLQMQSQFAEREGQIDNLRRDMLLYISRRNHDDELATDMLVALLQCLPLLISHAQDKANKYFEIARMIEKSQTKISNPFELSDWDTMWLRSLKELEHNNREAANDLRDKLGKYYRQAFRDDSDAWRAEIHALQELKPLLLQQYPDLRFVEASTLISRAIQAT